MSTLETAVDRQISFPLSNVLHVNGERNGQPLLHDFTEDIQFMDIEESSGNKYAKFSLSLKWLHCVLVRFRAIEVKTVVMFLMSSILTDSCVL